MPDLSSRALDTGSRSSLQRSQMAANGGGIDRATPVASYEAELSTAVQAAWAVGCLHALSRFLALCNLTWATVVLLGAFASKLLPHDFAFVVGLIVLEATRLASAAFFTRLLNRTLVSLSQDPKKIHHNEDGQYSYAHRARIFSHFLQGILISPSFILPAIRILPLSYDHKIHNLLIPLNYDYINVPDIHNLLRSLRIFYSLVLINSLVTLVNLICSAIAFCSLNKPPEQSILRYYDKVLENAMTCGVVEADDFVFLCFAYKMLGAEYSRNVQPEAVAKNHKRLIQYLYAHRLGMDFLQIYLDVEDVFVRQAAANMVGFWANSGWGGLEEPVKLPEELLTKLADRVGTGQVGWAAINSFGSLARKPAGAMLVKRTRTSRGESLLARLADLIDVTSSRSLSLVRTLIVYYQELCVNESKPPKIFEDPDPSTSLVPKLKELVEGAKVHRLRVQAAYLLLMMGEVCDPTLITAIDPIKDSYWFESEVSMLKLLREYISEDNIDVSGILSDIRKDTNISPPPWTKKLHHHMEC
eukprot:c25361_g1_i4 orf=175-1761(+)